MQRHSGAMFAINWNVTAPDAPTVAMTDLSLIAFPYPNELGTARFRLLSRASASVRRRRREPSNLQSSRRRARARRRPRVGTKSTSPAKFGRSHRPARRRRASRSSDGSLARDPRGNESRADQRLSFPRPTARPAARFPARRSKFSLHRARLPIVIPRLGGQRNALPARTCRTGPYSCHQRQGRTSLPSIGRAREAARIDGRSGVALRRCRRLHDDLALPGGPLRRAECESDSARRRANQSRVLNFIQDRKQQYIWVRLGHSEDHPESYGSPSSYSARRLLWLGYPSR